MKIILPENVSYIINKLEENGYEAYAVGGCVRDTLLGREPQDWDITTSAKPMQVKEIFKKTIDTGIKHGTVTVMRDHMGYEVTTYRIDGEYEDNRHPKNVEFTSNLRLDLERRDFTINAMAYNDTAGLVDEFGGINDLEKGIIRCVGDAGKRYDEDALRMLRAVRFSGQLGFDISPDTRQAIVERAWHLKNISAERIRVELTKLLVSKGAGMIREAYSTGMTSFFIPEFDETMEVEQHNHHHIYTVGEHCIRSVENMNCFFGLFHDESIRPDISDRAWKNISEIVKKLNNKQHTALCVTMLLHDIAKPKVMEIDENGTGHFIGHPQESEAIAVAVLRRLTFDNDTISVVRRLIKYHDYRIKSELKCVRRAASKIGADIMEMLFLVQYADIYAQNPETFEEKLDNLNETIDLFAEVVRQNMPLTLKELKVSGRDLIAEGHKPGPQLGELLGKLLDRVIEEPELNDKQKLLEIAKEIVKN